MQKLKILKFWMVAFSVIAWNTLKSNNWHMAFVDFHLGDEPDGRPIRKRRLMAKQSCNSLDVYWEQW